MTTITNIAVGGVANRKIFWVQALPGAIALTLLLFS